MLFVEVPSYRDQTICHPAKVNFYVINGKKKRSQPQHFIYTPVIGSLYIPSLYLLAISALSVQHIWGPKQASLLPLQKIHTFMFGTLLFFFLTRDPDGFCLFILKYAPLVLIVSQLYHCSAQAPQRVPVNSAGGLVPVHSEIGLLYRQPPISWCSYNLRKGTVP